MSTEPAAGTRRPEHIGVYRVLDTLGEGGMGTVYLAEQKEPVRRRVALKVIKLGMDSKAVLTRFEAERRALAMMEHSCIATVFDAGLTEQGQPFFAMEYVKGIPITDYCDQNKLSLQQRIELFQKVCSGVQHAHLKGVMHRDLKPSNVLVTLQDGKPTPKIIDFGLAKATDHHLVEATLYTEQGQVIGTPEYMSPEQAGLGGLDVDTRTDVYSLGVLLYELLVGELPFSRQALRTAGLLEMQRVIREQEPVKPSTKITTVGDAAGSHAAARSMDARELQKRLRGDLDWIVLKALEKDRTRRYETALELAADLGRHLSFEPVLASPPSVGYRVKKFVRRYRVQCAAAAIVFVAIVGGGIGTYLGFAAASARASEIALLLQNERAANEKNRIYADVTRLAEARAIEETLYPAFPDKVQAMRDWLTNNGEPLAARLPELQAALTELRGKALPRSDAEQKIRRESHPRFPELQRRQSELAQESDTARRSDLREQIATIESEIAVAGWEFTEAGDSYLHRTLTRLVNELQVFTGERGKVAEVRTRLVEAEGVRQKTVHDHRKSWTAARTAISASDGASASRLYEHFLLQPQTGLVPIGMDRESKLWEFVHLASGTPGKEIPTRDEATGRVVPNGDMGIVFVLLPAGTLPVEDGEKAMPRNRVRLDPFFLGKYEMTQRQWLRLAGDNPSNSKNQDGAAALPVQAVSWFDWEELLRHQGFVLPSELQWEYGCRAGTTTPWWCGEDEESLKGKENVDLKGGDAVRLMSVGSLAPNPFGLYNVSGNLSEWCLDDYGEYGIERSGDGLRPRGEGSSLRVIRGGLFVSGAAYAQSGFRSGNSPTLRNGYLGARPARTFRL